MSYPKNSPFEVNTVLKQLKSIKDHSAMERIDFSKSHAIWLMNALETMTTAYLNANR